MPMTMKFTLALFAVFSLTACGVQQNGVSGFQRPSSQACVNSAKPRQFMVRNRDGSVRVVHAESEREFLDGYMKANASQIQYAEHDYDVHTPKIVQAERADQGSPSVDNWGPIKVHADDLWAQNVYGLRAGNSPVVVAVVDSGVDISHSQLQSQIFVNPGEAGAKATNGIDDDANGFVDDYTGWNFVDDSPLKGDNQYHGTHVAGVIAAYHTDTVAQAKPYVQGMAPKAKILPLAFLDDQGSGSISNGVRAIQYAVSRGANVINASWGGTQCSVTLRDEIALLAAHNIAFVNAAGNDSQNIDLYPEYPASLNLASQITIGATGDHDYMAEYSNYGSRTVHIFAPGTNIVSTLPNGDIGFLSGTSMATPFVVGAVALLWGAVPTATVDQIRHALYNSAVHNAQYISVSQGRLNLATAMSELQKLVGP